MRFKGAAQRFNGRGGSGGGSARARGAGPADRHGRLSHPGICLAHSVELLTRNRAHFERVPGLRLAGLDPG